MLLFLTLLSSHRLTCWLQTALCSPGAQVFLRYAIDEHSMPCRMSVYADFHEMI